MNSFDRILVIRLSAMGDIVLTTPVLRWIKKTYPESRLDLLVKSLYRPLMEGHPDADRIHGLPAESGWKALLEMRRFLRRQRYDAVVDLQANARSRWLAKQSGAPQILYYRPMRWKRFLLVRFGLDTYPANLPVPMRYLNTVASWGVRDDGGGASLYPSPAAREKAGNLLKQWKRAELKPGRMIVMAPGAGRKTKQWPAELFAETGKRLQERGNSLVLTGGENDRSVCETVNRLLPEKALNLSGRLSMTETAAIIEKSQLLVTNDTGVMHMAGAVHTPLVAIFGPTTEQLGFFPFRSESRVVENRNLKCRPCSFHGTSRCPRGHFRCMREITPDAVLKAVDSIQA